MKFKILWIASLMLAATAGPVQGGVQLISNGGFETGDFAGWTTVATPGGVLDINAVAPIAGGFDAHFSQTDPSLTELTQTFTLSGPISLATLSWSDRLFSSAVPTLPPVQEFRVLIKTLGGALSHSVFSSGIGTTVLPGPNPRLFDLTTWAQANVGGTFQLSFEVSAEAPFDVYVDDVSFMTTGSAVVPEPASLAMWGLGALGMMFVRRKRQQKKLAA